MHDPWHHGDLQERSGAKRDFMQVARAVAEQAVGEHMDGTPLDKPDAGKNAGGVAFGRLGGHKGGAARAAKRRLDIATKAAAARWKKDDKG